MYHDDVAKCQNTWNGVVSRDIWTPPRVSDDQAMGNMKEQLFKEAEISLNKPTKLSATTEVWCCYRSCDKWVDG